MQILVYIYCIAATGYGYQPSCSSTTGNHFWLPFSILNQNYYTKEQSLYYLNTTIAPAESQKCSDKLGT